MDVYFEVTHFAADFKQFHYVGGVALDRFYTHVVIHSLLHESSLGEIFRIVTDHLGIKSIKSWQMVQHVSAVITQVAYWVISIMWVIKSAYGQTWKSVQIEHLFEISNLISRKVNHRKRYQAVKPNTDLLDIIS